VPVDDESRPEKKKRRSRWRWIVGIALGLVLALGIALAYAVSHAEPIVRARVIETLSIRFKSKVELSGFHVSVHHGVQVTGENLRIYGDTDPNIHQPGVQPLIAIAEFRFGMPVWNLLKTPMHVRTVYVKGLALNIPPKQHRQQMNRLRTKAAKAKIFVDHYIFDNAVLVINTSNPDKLPLVFDIESLELKATAPGQPLRFNANLLNPKPVGIIHSVGLFGPWQADSPRDTPVKGGYTFSDADLSTIKGLGGTLSSTGEYVGTLDNIVVDGRTDTPDFSVSSSGHPVPLRTEFHAIVDGTSGDTFLRPVKARILRTVLLAEGFVVRQKQPAGRRVKLDVSIPEGRIEDLLRLGIRTDPPLMTGAVRLKTKFDLPAADVDIADRLTLAGTFQVSGVHFTNDKWQTKIDSLSLRSQGKPKLAKDHVPDNVPSELSGTFELNHGLLSFRTLHFEVPGMEVNVAGKYSLDGKEFDFHGKARMEATISHMVTGWKAILLKPVDPFFKKHGAGTELPVKITGTKSEPHFGLDFGHKSSPVEARQTPFGR
jgi:hypothetical protein